MLPVTILALSIILAQRSGFELVPAELFRRTSSASLARNGDVDWAHFLCNPRVGLGIPAYT
jgi:hypothetical protein